MESDPAVPARLDHVVIGVPDLTLGIDWFESTTSVCPVPGGEHPELGTHNAVAGLGGGRYLELLASNPARDHESPITEWLARIERPTPFGWAISCTEAPSLADTLTSRGLSVQHLKLHRASPQGQDLQWQVVMITHALASLLPFFIDWETTPHPAQSAPQGCQLNTFTLQCDQPGNLTSTLELLGVVAAVSANDKSGFRITIETPAGELSIAP
jgi:hypothetical protein